MRPNPRLDVGLTPQVEGIAVDGLQLHVLAR
jgi:hypothetical protein